MIIGVSGGDIILGINLLRDSLQALSNTAGSQQQYLDAVNQLQSLELCLKVAECKLSDIESTDSRIILARAISECATCINGYQKEISKYETYFCSEGSQRFRHRCVREWRKIQWLHDKDKTEALSKTIASHVQIITLACSIGSLPQSSNSTRSQSKLSDELAKVLQPSHHLPASAPRNPRWSLEAKLDAAAIDSYPASKGKRRQSADERQRFPATNSLSTSRAPSCESLRSVQTLKRVPGPECDACHSLSADDIMPLDAQESSADSIRFVECIDTQDETYASELYQATASNPPGPRNMESTPNVAPSIFSEGTTPAASLFSRRGSDATSITVPSIAPSTTSNIPWVDGNGVCQNPDCQQRTFLQRKAFSLYTRLIRNAGSKESLRGQHKGLPACEHVLLYLQTMRNVCLSGSEIQLKRQ